jgi:hypothetical protein
MLSIGKQATAGIGDGVEQPTKAAIVHHVAQHAANIASNPLSRACLITRYVAYTAHDVATNRLHGVPSVADQPGDAAATRSSVDSGANIACNVTDGIEDIVPDRLRAARLATGDIAHTA